MPVLRRLFVSTVVPASLVAISVMAACSNSASTTGGGGGGGGGTGSSATFCEALTTWNKACGSTDQANSASCDADLVSGCSSYSSFMNPALLAAAAQCLDNNVDCDVTPTGCLSGAATNLGPSTAQTQLENDYCTTCQAAGADDCEETFFSGTGPVTDVGTEIIPYSDAIAGQMDACVTGSSCASTFVQCAENVVLAALGANAAAGTCVIKTFAAPKSTTPPQQDASTGTSSDASSPTDGSTSETDAMSSSDAGSQSDGGTGGGDDGGGNTCGDHYEPNNTPDTASTLAELDDDAGTVTINAFISVPGEDQDWYTYLGNDAFNFTTKADPYVSVDAKVPMQACVWAKETGGYAIPSPTCTAGTLTPFPGVPGYIGCCTNGGTTAQIANYGRTGSDDSSQVVMSVTMSASAQMCVPYNLTYAFVN